MNDCPPNIRLFFLIEFSHEELEQKYRSPLCVCTYTRTYMFMSYIPMAVLDKRNIHPVWETLILSVCLYTPNGTFCIIIDEMVNEKKTSFKCVYELNSFEWLIDGNAWMWDIFGASWIFQRVSIQSYQNFITNGLGLFSKHFQQQQRRRRRQQRQPEWRSKAMKIVQDFANNVGLSHLGAFYLL